MFLSGFLCGVLAVFVFMVFNEFLKIIMRRKR